MVQDFGHIVDLKTKTVTKNCWRKINAPNDCRSSQKIKKITDIYIITRKDLYDQIINEIKGIDSKNVIVEPLERILLQPLE